jgi:hypothetical protein
VQCSVPGQVRGEVANMLESLTGVVQGATAVTVHQVHLHCTATASSLQVMLVTTIARLGSWKEAGSVRGPINKY